MLQWHNSSQNGGLKHGERIMNSLSELAQKIGQWLSKKSENGVPDTADPDGESFQSDFSGIDSKAIDAALEDLEMNGYIKTRNTIGKSSPSEIVRTLELFTYFDPIALGTDPCSDAVKLIDLILEMGESIDARKLHPMSTMSLRQFNPALGIIIEQVKNENVRQGRHQYVCPSFRVDAEDRKELINLREYLSSQLSDS